MLYRKYGIIFWGIIGGSAVWFMDAFLDYRSLDSISFSRFLVFDTSPHELFIRILFSFSIIFFGVLIYLLQKKQPGISAHAHSLEIRRYLDTALHLLNETAYAESEKQILQQACDSIFTPFDAAFVWAVTFDDSGEIASLASHGHETELEQFIQMIRNGTPPECLEKATATPGVFTCGAPSSHCVSCPLCDVHEGYRLVHSRLWYGGSNLGILTVGLNPETLEDPESLQLFHDFAQNIAHGTQRIRLEKMASSSLAELEEEKLILQALIGNATDSIYMKDPSGRYVHANQEMADAIGKTVEEIIGCTDWELFLPEEAETFTRVDRKVLETGKPTRIESDHEHFHRGHRYYITNKYPVHNETGEIIGVVGISHDITDIKSAQEVLKSSEQNFRNILKITRDGIVVVQNKQVQYINESITRILGYESWEVVGKDYEQFLLPGERSKIAVLSKGNLSRESKHPYFQTFLLNRDGRPVQVEISAGAIRFDGKDAWLVFVRDVTEEQMREQALKENEQRLRLSYQAARMGAWEWNITTDCLIWSYGMEEASGISGDEIRGSLRNLVRKVHPEDRHLFRKKNLQALLEKYEDRLGSLEFRVCPASDQVRWVQVLGKLIHTEKTSDQVVIGVLVNITEQKRMELALNEHRLQMQMLIDQSPMAIEIYSVDGKLVRVNRAFQHFWQVSPETRLHHFNILKDSQMKELGITDKFIAACAGESSEIEDYHYDPAKSGLDGRSRWLHSRIYPIKTEKGEILQIVLVHEDITARKSVTIELSKSESKYQLLHERIQDSILQFDLEGKLQEWNRAFSTLSGYTMDECGELTVEKITPEKWIKFEKDIISNQLMIHHYSKIYEKEILDKSGELVPVESQLHSVIDPSGKIIGYWSIMRDISERKKAEEQFFESQARFKIAAQCASDLVYEWDLQKNRVEWFGDIHDALGYFDSEFGISAELWLQLIHPDDFAQVQQDFVRHREQGEPLDVEYRIQHQNGQWLHWVNRGTAVFGDQDKPVKLIGACTDITDRVRALELMQESEKKYRNLVDHSNDMIYLIYKGRFELYNQKFLDCLEVTEEDFQSKDFDLFNYIAPQSREMVREQNRRRKEGKPVPVQFELTILSKTGKEIDVEASVTEIPYKNGKAIQGILRDISERKRLEAQFRQSQKMEAVGRLAGGVAHDFNNLLTVISGTTELALFQMDPVDPLYNDLSEILKASKRASNLTGSLLAFSRRQSSDPVVLNINTIVNDMGKMLKRMIREDISLELDLDHELGLTKIDRVQLEQVIANLCVNARDAMPDGGTLKIRTENIIFEKDKPGIYDTIPSGQYLKLTITDTGVGIPKKILTRIFDPFFTTKEEGKGTGLGLSTVFGIVKQHNGYIELDSLENQGTTFMIYFPRATGEEEAVSLKQMDDSDLPRGSEKILVVEDEDIVRDMTMKILSRLGYDLHQARSAPDALQILEKAEKPFDLIISDIVMPIMQGTEFYDIVMSNERYRSVCFLLMSGYNPDESFHVEITQKGIPFLQKPFSPAGLAGKVRNLLDKKSE